MFLLDTNTCIRLLNEAQGDVQRHFLAHGPAELRLCSIVKAELLYGARHSQRVEQNLELLKRFFAPLESFPFDDRSAEEYGRLRHVLASQGKPIGPNDLMIAAIALANDLILVTHNSDEFLRVPGLRMVDWERPE
jgi:tRNA(fMet)-specific endonuclease VapC